MISTDFHKLIELFIAGAGSLQPGIFGLNSFSKAEFIKADFELFGDLGDFHFFEKAYDVPYFRRKITVVFKQYFFADESLGGGLGVANGVRLTSLLRSQPFASAARSVDQRGIALFLSEDQSEGALIFDEKIVIRFNRWSSRSSYVISTVECDFDNERFGDLAKKAVHDAYEFCDHKSMINGARFKGGSSAFNRLIRKLELFVDRPSF
ncbi:hypothetical protein [Pseudomonas sp. IT-347P]|uniref:hypothetical protein n=1 Tax=Pseudomonas sp. IT-347P TaxID=3026458 RepID=UPI0039E1DE9D